MNPLSSTGQKWLTQQPRARGGASASEPKGQPKAGTSWLPELRPPTGITSNLREELDLQRGQARAKNGAHFSPNTTALSSFSGTQPTFGKSSLGLRWETRRNKSLGALAAKNVKLPPATLEGRRSMSDTTLLRKYNRTRDISTAVRSENASMAKNLQDLANAPDKPIKTVVAKVKTGQRDEAAHKAALLQAVEEWNLTDKREPLDTGSVMASITELQRGMSEFDPRVPGGRAAKTQILEQEDEKDEHAEFLVRMEAYKMGRVIQGDIPPLDRDSLPPRGLEDVVRRPQIERNRHPQVLLNYAPQPRKELMRHAQEERAAQRDAVKARRETEQGELEDAYEEELARKELQGEAALERARKAKGKKTKLAVIEGISEVTRMWVTKIAVIKFAESFDRAIRLQRHTKIMGSCVAVMKAAAKVLFVHKEEQDALQRMQLDPIEVLRRLENVARKFKKKSKLLKKRVAIEMVAKTLGKFDCPMGHLFYRLRRLCKFASTIQKWWRECAKRLHNIKETLNSRWRTLEINLLVKEGMVEKADAQAALSPQVSPKARRTIDRDAPESRRPSKTNAVFARQTSGAVVGRKGAEEGGGGLSRKRSGIPEASPAIPEEAPSPPPKASAAAPPEGEAGGKATVKRPGVGRWSSKSECKVQQEQPVVARRRSVGQSFCPSPLAVHMIPEDVRMLFIENELRVRRFAMIPRMDVWKQELHHWRKEMEKVKELKEAMRCINPDAEDPHSSMFMWPPVCPSHLPPKHVPSEADHPGEGCRGWCPGKRGDEEIVNMLMQARENPKGWKRVCKRIDHQGRSYSFITSDPKVPQFARDPPPPPDFSSAKSAGMAVVRMKRKGQDLHKQSLLEASGVDMRPPGVAAMRKKEEEADFTSGVTLVDQELALWGVDPDGQLPTVGPQLEPDQPDPFLY